MATTHSTDYGNNKYYIEGGPTLYGDMVAVNTGNEPDSDPKVVNGKYNSGKIKNMTYTLQASDGVYEESGILLNYDDYIYYDNTYIFGHPDKWIFDAEQKYNNCGVVSALNILSMAGIIDMVAPTEAEIEEMSAPITKTDRYGNEYEVIPKIDFTSSEEMLTLYAIQKDYCNHSMDIDAYKSINDIQEDDGGTYFVDINSEEHLYHDTMSSVMAILSDYGISSHLENVSVYLQANYSEADEAKKWTDDNQSSGGGGEEGEKQEEVESDDIIIVRSKTSGNMEIDSTNGSDKLYFADLTLDDVFGEFYTLVKDGTDLIINYNETNYIKILNVFPDPDSSDPKYTHVYSVKFSDGQEISLDSFMAQDQIYSKEAMDTPTKKYGYFVRQFAQLVQEGKGIMLRGMATENFDAASNPGGPNHAIVLTGVSYKFYDANKSIFDIDGFYVVDSGGWLSQEATGAQKISCEQLYNFVSSSLFLTKNNYGAYGGDTDKRRFDIQLISTDEAIKGWADDLNLVGNAKRNNLIGNEGNNILKGGSSVDILYGMGGNDTIYGEDGNDWLYGGDGNNTLYGGKGNDTYVIKELERTAIYRTDDEGNQILDGEGNPEFIGYEKYELHDIIVPGDGKDTLRFEDMDGIDGLKYYNDNGDLVIRYDEYLLDKDTDTYGYNTLTVKDYFKKGLYSNIFELFDKNKVEAKEKDDSVLGYKFFNEINQTKIQYDIDETTGNKINGTKFNDEIIAGDKNDTIQAGDGNDIIKANAGDDIIKVGAGYDEVYLNYGNNNIYLEKGENVVKYEDYISGYDTINPGKGEDEIELTSKTRADLSFSRNKNNLVIYYDEHGSSITLVGYFAKKGITSIQAIKLSDGNGGYTYLDLRDEYNDIVSSLITNIDDTIKTANTPEGILGGYGCDILGGVKGDNTFVFNTLYDGVDTIKSQPSGSITIDLTATAIELNSDNSGFVDGYERYNLLDKNYAFSKSGNNLIINYGKQLDQESMSRIILQNYFKASSKVTYNLKTADDNIDLRNAIIYFEGIQNSKNNITGSNQNDIITGGDLNDTIKGGAGNDVIYGGKGDDNITGGAGNNTIYYNHGDGSDMITLSKGENLNIVLQSNDEHTYSIDEVSYSINKKGHLEIYSGEDLIMTIKDFGKKDTTGADGSVHIYVDNALVTDLKNDIFIPTYTAFSKGKISYNGKWYSERIDASSLVNSGTSVKGVTINAGAGDDIVIGSSYNDTINGGAGDDLIVTGDGTNKLNGGAGNDTYYIFYDDEIDSSNLMKSDGKSAVGSVTTIKDSGNLDGEIDKAVIYANKGALSIWFDTDREGNPIETDVTLNIKTTDSTKNEASITGVEFVVTKDNYKYNYENTTLKAALADWFSANPKFTSVKDVLKNGRIDQKNELIALFTNGWETVSASDNYVYYDDFSKQKPSYKGKWYAEEIDASGLAEAIDGDKQGVSINGGGGDDYITGSNFDDILMGGTGDDTILGGNGDDTIIGESGMDIIFGGDGNDTIDSGEGNDTISGGAGANTYVFHTGDGSDVIVDANSTDTILIDSVTDVTYTNMNGSLLISYGRPTKPDYITIDNFDFTNPDSNIDIVKVLQANGTYKTYSIKDDCKINVELYNDDYTATSYNEVFSGYGTVSNISANDSIAYISAILSRKASSDDLIIKSNDGSIIVKTITIKDFFDNPVDFKIGSKNSTDYVLNVDLEGVAYTAEADYTEIISNSGTVVALDNSDILSFTDTEKSELVFNLNGSDTGALAVGALSINNDVDTIIVNDYVTNPNLNIIYNNKEVDITKYNLNVNGYTEYTADETFGSYNIIGTANNDTYNGSKNADTISGGAGTNTIDGKNGDDTYELFKDVTGEITTVNDTGEEDTDLAKIFVSKDDLKLLYDESSDTYLILNIDGEENILNRATLTGVEEVKIYSDDTCEYEYDYSKVKQDITSWLSDEGFADIASVFTDGDETQQNTLFTKFAAGWKEYSEQVAE